MHRTHLVIFLAMGLLPLALGAQQPCSPNAAISQVRARQADLLEARVDEMSTEVPAAMRTQLHSFKMGLASAVDAGMACASASADAAVLQSSLATMLNANQVEKPVAPPTSEDNKFDTGTYGDDLKVVVSTPSNAPTLRAIEVTFGIECGSDTMLLMYRPTTQGWQRILRWQSGDYDEISGAFGDFFRYALLPGDAGSIHVVVAHGTPWCTSRFSGFKIDVLKSNPDGGVPRVLWHTERGYSRFGVEPRLRPTTDGFELRLNAPAAGSASFERKVIYRYRVAEDKVTRIEPIAGDARGFVEEWLSAPWEEANGQTAPDAADGMKAVHERIAKSDHDANTYVSFTYGPVRSCLMKNQYEVEMVADPGGPQFYAVKEVPNGYMMVNYGTTQDERCSGPDLMKKR